MLIPLSDALLRKSPAALISVALLLASLASCRTLIDDEPPPPPAEPAAPAREGPPEAAAEPAREPALGTLEPVAPFHGAMPTGVAVSAEGRVFVSFPRWGDLVESTLAEVRDGRVESYPPKLAFDPFLSVQSVVVDATNTLWALDTGSVRSDSVAPRAAQLVAIDLGTDSIIRSIEFPEDVVLPTSYLNDVRFDLRRGRSGMAFITDSSFDGPNAIVVVDLATGKSWRKLHGHSSTSPDPSFVGTVEGRELMERKPGQLPTPFLVGADGIALGTQGEYLYWCPLSSRTLYRVRTDLLVDPTIRDRQVAAAVEQVPKDFASDGLEAGADGWIYLTDWEHNAIRRLRADDPATIETVVQAPELLWPDSMALGRDRWLYVIANQLHRSPRFHEGADLRRKPYGLYRVKVDDGPVLLPPEIQVGNR